MLGGWGALGAFVGDVLGDVIAPNSGKGSTFLQTVISTGLWFAFVGALMSIAIAIGQARYLGGKPITWKTILPSGAFGFAAGSVAGVVAQATYTIIGPTELLRDFCWGLAGGLVGSALSLRIPNLGFLRGLGGGLVGGLLGGGLFILISYIASDIFGRYVGCAAIGFLIAFMIVISESLFREAWLGIQYGPKETRTVSLGSQPVMFGSDAARCTIFVRGLTPVAYSFTLRDKKIEFKDFANGRTSFLKAGSTQKIGTLVVAVNGA